MANKKKEADKPIQPIFSRNEDHRKIAFLNWRFQGYSEIQNLMTMANGFILAAIELADYSLRNNQHKIADILIFPVLTNANHGIELYLKGITWAINQLSGLSLRVEGGHNLDQILKTVKSKIRAWEGEEALRDFEREMEDLTSYVDELFAKIGASNRPDKMDFSRYPFGRDYENHFYVEHIGNVEVDLVNFIARFKRIHKSLELMYRASAVVQAKISE